MASIIESFKQGYEGRDSGQSLMERAVALTREAWS